MVVALLSHSYIVSYCMAQAVWAHEQDLGSGEFIPGEEVVTQTGVSGISAMDVV